MASAKNIFAAMREKLFPAQTDPQLTYIPHPQWYGSDMRTPIQNATQAQSLAPQFLRQAQDSATLLNETTSPRVFFERYDFLISRLDLLSKCSRWVRFSGTPPQLEAKSLRTIEKRNAVVDDFLERYKEHVHTKLSALKTAKGKKSNLEKLRTELLGFEDCLSPQQAQKMRDFFDNLSSTLDNEFSSNISSQDTKKRQPDEMVVSKVPSKWEVSLSFGPSRSPAFHQALYLWEHAPRHILLQEPTTIYQCFFSADPAEFLAYLQLYDIIKDWKTTSIILNGKLIDRKTMAKINYCYGDKCRCGKKQYCFGASDYSKNPFGCHRLQIESYSNPWYSFGRREGNRFIINKRLLKETIEENSTEYRLCPAFDLERVLKHLDELPNVLALHEIEKMDPVFYYSKFGN